MNDRSVVRIEDAPKHRPNTTHQPHLYTRTTDAKKHGHVTWKVGVTIINLLQHSCVASTHKFASSLGLKDCTSGSPLSGDQVCLHRSARGDDSDFSHADFLMLTCIAWCKCQKRRNMCLPPWIILSSTRLQAVKCSELLACANVCSVTNPPHLQDKTVFFFLRNTAYPSNQRKKHEVVRHGCRNQCSSGFSSHRQRTKDMQDCLWCLPSATARSRGSQKRQPLHVSFRSRGLCVALSLSVCLR